MWYERNGICAGWHTRTDTLRKLSKFVGKSSFPSGSIRAQNEVVIILCGACGGVEDGVASVKPTRLGPCVVGVTVLTMVILASCCWWLGGADRRVRRGGCGWRKRSVWHGVHPRK